MRIAFPYHVEASNSTLRPCPHCLRPVEVGEPIIVSVRDPEVRWLPVECYEQVWAAELALLPSEPIETNSEERQAPIDPDDLETFVELDDGSVVPYDEWLAANEGAVDG